MRAADWGQRYQQSSSWLREYGSQGVPIPVVAASPELRQMCDLLEELSSGQRRCVLLQAPKGGGKSTIMAAAIATFGEAGVDYQQLLPNGEHGPIMERIGRGGLQAVVLVDDCERLSSRTLRKLIEKRHSCDGMLLTANQISADISEHLSEETDCYLPIPPLEHRPEELLLIASTIWRQLVGPEGDELARSCDELAVKALSEGPYPDGAWSLQRVLTDVVSLLESSGDLVAGRLQRSISYADIAPLLLRLARERFTLPQVAPTNAVVVVEGDTDESYLLTAARLANEQKGWRLLDGLAVEAAARGRGGGGTAVVRRLQELHRDGTPAIGLFDFDVPGRAAYHLADGNGLQKLLLPFQFDPLGRDSQFAVVEVEDLLPVELLIRYYEFHHDKSPEEQHWRLGRLRIVPLGEDKGDIAGWVSNAATYEDLERLVYLLVQVRQRLGLPCAREMLDRGWLRRLQHQPVARSLNLGNVRHALVPKQGEAQATCFPSERLSP